jgi:DNA-binding NarL/FixJ family response regulator
MRILVADDHEIIRLGLRQLLTQSGWNICAEASNGEDAVTLARRFKPEIVIMDITMPRLNGIQAIRNILEFLPGTKIAVLTMHSSDQMIREIIEAGAQAYVMKSDADRELVTAIQTIANGGSYFTSGVPTTLLHPRQTPDPLILKNRLTPREREIVQLLAEGKVSREVAKSLGISQKTVETHRANAMRKLEVHSASELVRYAIKNKVVEA